MSLMGSLYVGKSGLSSSQYAINTTAHNLANVDTKGYIRQQTILGTTQFNTIGQNAISKMQVGLGVNTETVMQVREIFLDKAYRQEVGRGSFYRTQYEAIEEVEDIFGELQGVAFQNSLKNFWVALQEMAKEPDSIVTRASFVQTAFSFVERAENIYKQIAEYQVNLNTLIEQKVDRINEIGDEIAELNRKICSYESNKLEHANDLRDKRNSLLDELGEYINISYQEQKDGQISVYAEGVPFVGESIVMHMSTMTQSDLLTKKLGGTEEAAAEAERICRNSQFLVPVWTMLDNKEVFNFDRAPSAKANTDIGGLKGLVLGRGTKIANYTDIPIEPTEEDFTDEDGILDEDAYAMAVGKYKNDLSIYNNTLEPSVIMTIQAQFDQLIHGIVTMVNDLICPNTDYTFTADTTVTLSDGTQVSYKAGDTVKILDEKNAPVGMDANRTMGTEMFSRKSVSRYNEAELPDGTVIRIFNEEDPMDNYSLYTLGEIRINQEILADKSMLPLSGNDGNDDFDIKMVEEIIQAWGKHFAFLSPNAYTQYDFNDYYAAFIADIANRGESLNNIATYQDNMVEDIENKRLSTTAVSSDEELTNLIRFQHAYNAAARYMNVIDEMLEHIITRL